ncbi:ABC transporter ATP-binding protein [Halorussus salinisoli]|uniref:ABC transporter ATP-binding protein n=1 Tax=Halorussus salinisoli TaxID=2558242 RepID=UPI0010C1618A|nr:ABC transporter ATP-binding protein [Halorussus salinisoli]
MTHRTSTEQQSDESGASGDSLEPSASDERTNVLEVEGLGHSFDDVNVFSDLSFSVEAGTVTALVGPNGSGKTTLLRALLGLLEPDEGRVNLTAGGETGRRVGYLPQSPRFRPAFTVEETLRFYADLLDREVDVSAIVGRVGLSEASDRRVNALSGGMIRLLGVGQAILGDPPLVVLDEPTGDLDPRMTEYVFDVVRDLADDGMAVLLATHNLSGAEEADAVLLLDHGDVVAEGSPADFVTRTDADTFREAFLALTGREAGVDEEGTPDAPSVSVRTQGGDAE